MKRSTSKGVAMRYLWRVEEEESLPEKEWFQNGKTTAECGALDSLAISWMPGRLAWRDEDSGGIQLIRDQDTFQQRQNSKENRRLHQTNCHFLQEGVENSHGML